jgi:hypothetical protein
MLSNFVTRREWRTKIREEQRKRKRVYENRGKKIHKILQYGVLSITNCGMF